MKAPSRTLLSAFPQTVFLTGATGVLGGRILVDLLRTTAAHVYCLVRGRDPADSQQRVHELLRVYDNEGTLEPQFDARVTILCGDVTRDYFGLGAERFARLQTDTELTIHAAANTSLLGKYKRLEPVNVHGTTRVVEFSLGTRSKRLSFISTYTVMGDKTFDESVCFRETDYDLGQGFAHMNYQRSKFRAEAMVRAARERGLKWRIFRPGQIYGDSATGAYPHSATRVSGLFYDLFRTAMDTGVMPEAYAHYDVVPVDYVSRAVIALSGYCDNMFEVYHLINPDAKPFAQVMGLLREIGYAIELLPEEIYKQRLRDGQITKNGSAYSSAMLKAFQLWYFISKVSFFSSAVTDCAFTQGRLGQLGVSCAPLDRRLIETYVRAGIREGYFPRPARCAQQGATRTLERDLSLAPDGSAS
jgi:thioester reductase-like protein